LINGNIAALFIIWRAVPVASTNIGTFAQAMSYYDVQDNSVQSLIGYAQRSISSTNIIFAEYSHNLFGLYSEAYPVYWTRNFNDSLSTGSCWGWQPFDGTNQKLVWTTPSGLSGGSYQCDIIGRSYETIKVRKGDISVTNV